MKTVDLSDSSKHFQVTGSGWGEVLERGLEYVRDNAVAPTDNLGEGSEVKLFYRFWPNKEEYFLTVKINQHLPKS